MKRCYIIFLLLFLATGDFTLVRQGAYADAQKRILVVHSYHETQKGHVVEMTEGINEALKGCGARIEYFHMDTKRRNSIAWKLKAGETARKIVSDFAPHVVIAMDDNAQEYFTRHYVGQRKAPVIVFGGVNAEPEKYGFPAENVTGVIERPNVRESIELLQRIVPGVKRIVLLSDESPTTAPFCDYSKKLDLPVEVVACESVRTFDQWKAAVEKYRDRADAFGFYVIRTLRRSEEDNSHVPENELIDYVKENSELPTVGFFDSAARAGVLCGVSVSMKEQGYAAGKIAREILNGGKPSDHKVAATSKGRILLNLATADKMGIRIRYKMIKRADEVVK